MSKYNLKDSFSEKLIEVAASNKKVVVIDPEVARSTKMRAFSFAYPGRFYQVGVAEQNAVGVAAGLATEGNIVFCVAFSPFMVMRPIEMTRTAAAYPKLNVKIVGEYAGFTDGKDGATHECLEDVGMMRSIPGVVVVSPSTPNMTKAMVVPMIEKKGVAYIRVDNEDCEELYPNDVQFVLGKAYIVRKGADVTLAAYGSAVHRICEAAEELKKAGISAEVIDCATIKPIDRDTLVASVKKTGRLITLEDHNLYGGLASAVAEAVLGSGVAPKFKPLAVNDVFGISGNAEQLREYFGLAAKDVVAAAKELMK